MPDLLFEPVPHKEAIDFIKSKPIVSREVFDQLLPELKARAFTITGLEGVADVMQAVRDRIADLPAGANWDDVKSDIADDISPYLVDPSADPEHRDKQIDAANRRAELLLRMHGHAAYAAADYEIMDRQRDVFPYWQYKTMEDDRVRESHAALDGIVLPADHEFWLTHFPPWDWGCRCTVIPLSESDKDDEEKKDEDRPKDKQNVLVDDPEADELTSTRRLYRDGKVIDVSSPAETGKEGAFQWHPGNVHLSVDDLKQRYDAPTWGTFERWAKNTDIGDGRTVWSWITGSRSKPPRVPLEPAESLARKSPVSSAITVTVRGAHSVMVRRALNAIDSVHDDGQLPKIPIDSKAGRHLGVYLYYTATGHSGRIGVKKAGPWQHMTVAHEIGHFLDHQALVKPGEFASELSHELEHFRHAALNSEAVKAIHQSPGISNKMRDYFTSAKEIWARAYAQYVAQKSEDGAMLAELHKIQKSVQPWRQWTDEDFKPISHAIDTLFKKKKWL
jgi:SPP1 gp7 family putative phage head morphogenesis protein